jgi:hypothetical protein
VGIFKKRSPFVQTLPVCVKSVPDPDRIGSVESCLLFSDALGTVHAGSMMNQTLDT